MRISDWSSDVCSSDLCRTHRLRLAAGLVMKVDVITLFPELVEQVTRHGMPRIAVEGGQLQLSTRNPRDYSTNKWRRVAARPYGGGPGMVMEAEQIGRAACRGRVG